MRTLHQRWMQSCLVLVFHVKIPAIGDEIPIKVRTYENDTVMDSWH